MNRLRSPWHANRPVLERSLKYRGCSPATVWPRSPNRADSPDVVFAAFDSQPLADPGRRRERGDRSANGEEPRARMRLAKQSQRRVP